MKILKQNNITNKLKKKVDYKIEDQQERIDLVYKLLYPDGELHKDIASYFDNSIFMHPNKNQPLSESNYMCAFLNTLANYILFCPGAERITKKTKYNFYTDKSFRQLLKKNLYIDAMVDRAEGETSDESIIDRYDETIDFLIRKSKNYKKDKKQKIDSQDMDIQLDKSRFKGKKISIGNRNEFDDIKKVTKIEDVYPIKENQDSIDSMKKILDDLRSKGKEIKKTRILAELMKKYKKDQYYYKDAILGTIYFKDVLPDSTGETDFNFFDFFDFFDEEHVLALLKCRSRDITEDLGLLVHDLDIILEQVALSDLDKRILELYRDKDMIQEDIGEVLGVKQQFVDNTLDKICNRVIDKFEEIYEDWYYLNLVRGKYKKCSKCKQIKLANERYFRRRSDKKGDGFYNQCRKCEY